MKFNSRIRYGLRAMVEIAKSNQEKGIFQKDISKNQGISIKYLDQIIRSLKTAGLIVNINGKKSGYRLTRDADKINVLEIHAAFEHEIAVVDCMSEFIECELKEKCHTSDFWQGLNEIIIEYFTNASLEDLVGKRNPDNLQ